MISTLPRYGCQEGRTLGFRQIQSVRERAHGVWVGTTPFAAL